MALSKSDEAGFFESRLIQFAKVPRLGGVKTRLQPRLSPEQCLALHQALVERTYATLQQVRMRGRQCPMELWIDGPDSEHYFSQFSPPPTLRRQRGKDLGERMYLALKQVLHGADGAVLVGSDCPPLDQNYLLSAFSVLDEYPVVIGPAEDGGYVLIGMRDANSDVFRDIDWGSARVLSQTRQRLRDLNLPWRELPALWDVDRPEDLLKLEGLECEMAGLLGGGGCAV